MIRVIRAEPGRGTDKVGWAVARVGAWEGEMMGVKRTGQSVQALLVTLRRPQRPLLVAVLVSPRALDSLISLFSSSSSFSSSPSSLTRTSTSPWPDPTSSSPRHLTKLKQYSLDLWTSLHAPSLPQLLAFDACSHPTTPTSPHGQVHHRGGPAHPNAAYRGQILPRVQEVGRR